MDKIKIDKLTKYIMSSSIILMVLLILVAVKFSNKKTDINTDYLNQAITPTPTSIIDQNRDKFGKQLKPIVSPSGDLSAFLSIEKNFVLKLQIKNKDGGYYRLLKEGGKLTPETSIDILEHATTEKDSKYIDFIFGEYWNYTNPLLSIAAISPNDDSIAILMPNKAIVIVFETGLELVNSVEPAYSLPTLRITDIVELPINLVTDKYFYPQVFYSNEGNVIYFSNNGVNNSDWAYKFDLTSKETETINHITPRELYLLNNSDGLVYWGKPDQISNRSELDFITLDYDNSQKTINILDNRQNPNIGNYDYPGFITINSSHTALCAERGYSGSWGYVIGKISGNQLITLDTGSDYSYCITWKNNDEVVVEEKSYFNQHFKKIYIFNIQTREKKLILVEENETF